MQVPLQLYDLNGAGYRTVWRDAAPRLPSRDLGWTPRVWLQRPRGHFYGAPRLMPITSSRGKGATPLPARLSLALARAQCIWVPQTSFYSAGTEERREGRCASSRRAKPGSGRGPANVGAQAIIQSCWSRCRAAEGRDAAPRSPAQAGPHVSGCRGHHAIRLCSSTRVGPCWIRCHLPTRPAPSSGRRCLRSLPAGPNPARAGARHV